MSVDEVRYLRITPYSPKTGALAQKVCVGSQIFVQGIWYTMRTTAAARLAQLVQVSGVPYFQVCTQDQWSELARRETLAAARAHGIPVDGPVPAPHVSAAPKRGPRVSEFADLGDEEIGEVAGAEALMGVPAGAVDAHPDETSGGEGVVADSGDERATGMAPAAVPSPTPAATQKGARRVVVGRGAR